MAKSLRWITDYKRAKINILGEGVQRSVFRNMAIVLSGSVIARAVGIVSGPVVSRLYLPEHFGVLSVFMSVTVILSLFGSFRYSMAIPLVRNDRSLANLVVLCFCLLAGFCVLVTIFLYFFGDWIFKLFNAESIRSYWWILILTVAGTGTYEILSQWVIREKAFKALAKTRLWQAIDAAAIKIGLGLFGIKPLGLLLGEVANESAGILSLGRILFGRLRDNLKSVKGKYLKFFLRRYIEFPLFRLPSQFLLVLTSRIPILFFAYQYGADVTGKLGFALAIVGVPMTMLGNAIGQTYYGEIAALGRKDVQEIYEITKSLTFKLLLLSLPPFIIFFISAPSLFSFVYGERWREAGFFASLLSLYLLPQFISSPLVNVLNVLEKQRLFFMLNLVRLILVGSVFMTSAVCGFSPKLAIQVYSVTLFIQYSYTCWVIFRTLKREANTGIMS